MHLRHDPKVHWSKQMFSDKYCLNLVDWPFLSSQEELAANVEQKEMSTRNGNTKWIPFYQGHPTINVKTIGKRGRGRYIIWDGHLPVDKGPPALVIGMFCKYCFSTSFYMSAKIPPGGLPLWRWRGCKAPGKTPYFQRYCHPMTPYFCWLSLLSPKDPTYFGEIGLLNRSHPKTPLFFAFGSHRKLLFVSISSTNW